MASRLLVLIITSLLGPRVLGQKPSAAPDPAELVPPVAEREDRYRPVRFLLDAPPEAALAVPGFEAMLRQIGILERAQPGESVELMALYLGREPRLLRLTSGFDNGHRFDTDELVCIERHHLLLPEEDLGFVAELHQTDVQTLRELNALQVDQDPTPWTEILVPARYDAALHEDEEYRTVRVFFGAIDLVRGGGPLEITRLRLLRHVVKDGDTRESVAEAHGVTVEDRRFGRSFVGEFRRWMAQQKEQGQPVSDSPGTPGQPARLVVGERIPVATSADLRPGRSLFELVLTFEYLCGDLRKLLDLKGLDSPEGLQGCERVEIPLAVPSLRAGSAKP